MRPCKSHISQELLQDSNVQIKNLDRRRGISDIQPQPNESNFECLLKLSSVFYYRDLKEIFIFLQI